MTSAKRSVAKKPSVTPVVDKLSIAENKSGPKLISITKNGASKEQNEWIMQIYHECGNDLDAVLTVEAESGFILMRKGNKQNNDGSWDWGLFQLNSHYNKAFINSPEFKNSKDQISYGCMLWKGSKKKSAKFSPWYAYRNIAASSEAREDIMKRFTITYN